MPSPTWDPEPFRCVLGSRAETLQQGFGDVDSSKRFWIMICWGQRSRCCWHPACDRVIESSSQECKGENRAGAG